MRRPAVKVVQHWLPVELNGLCQRQPSNATEAGRLHSCFANCPNPDRFPPWSRRWKRQFAEEGGRRLDFPPSA